MARTATVKKPKLLKLDFGCGKNKKEGFEGVDILDFKGVDHVLDIRKTPWPWGNESVLEAHSSHFVEHLDGPERVDFFNELYRVLVWGGTAQITCPSWSHDRAYGDPTHKWPPVSGWTVIYLNKQWRDENAPHCGYTCDFDWTSAGNIDPWLATRSQEARVFAMARYINSTADFIFNLTKVKRK